MEEWGGHYILAPKNASPPDTSMIYINIGGVISGSQKFPDYHYGLMQSICSQRQYQDLIREVRAFFASPAHSSLYSWCSCWSWGHGQTRPTLDLLDLHEIIFVATEHWRTPAELFVCEEINVVDHHDNSVALDDHGEVLMIAKDPIWPPMGVNLVFKVSGSSLRSHWMDLCRTSLSHVQTYSHDETPDRHAIAKRRQVTMMEGLTMEEME